MKVCPVHFCLAQQNMVLTSRELDQLPAIRALSPEGGFMPLKEI